MRYLLGQRKNPLTRRQKWLLIARLLDALEEDYRKIYPNDIPPFEDGFEESLRKLLTYHSGQAPVIGFYR